MTLVHGNDEPTIIGPCCGRPMTAQQLEMQQFELRVLQAKLAADTAVDRLQERRKELEDARARQREAQARQHQRERA